MKKFIVLYVFFLMNYGHSAQKPLATPTTAPSSSTLASPGAIVNFNFSINNNHDAQFSNTNDTKVQAVATSQTDSHIVAKKILPYYQHYLMQNQKFPKLLNA